MRSVLEEIQKLRKDEAILIDYHNSNRYRLVVNENDGSKTAYYFTTPIYNKKTRKMVDVKFLSDGVSICSTGSNTDITIRENILLKNNEGSCNIELPCIPRFISSKEVQSGNNMIIPTVNGVAMKCCLKDNQKISFIIEVDQPFLSVRANDKYFALMKERFKPFVIFSCIGSADAEGNVIAPAKIEYQKLSEKRYMIEFSTINPSAEYILFESNLYENKLLQDTTVESANPSTNNAFGSTGFIGNTSTYGEQWLYSKLDYLKILEVMDKRIQKAVLHMPKLNQSNVELAVFKVLIRFCSFGSNWHNKVPGSVSISDSLSNKGYQSVDLTQLLVDEKTKNFMKSEGLILKPKVKGSGFSVISTGDSCYAPQILEINFR